MNEDPFSWKPLADSLVGGFIGAFMCAIPFLILL